MVAKGNSRRMLLKPVPSGVSRPEPKIPGTTEEQTSILEQQAPTTAPPKRDDDHPSPKIATKPKPKPVSKEVEQKRDDNEEGQVAYQDFFIPITTSMNEALIEVSKAYEKTPKDLIKLLTTKAHEVIKDDPKGEYVEKLQAIKDEKAAPLWKHRVRNSHLTDIHLETMREKIDPMGLELDRNLMARIYQRILGKLLNLK